MPTRATAVLLVLFAISAVAFGLALLALGREQDLMALLLGIIGALGLRALHQAAKVAEGSR